MGVCGFKNKVKEEGMVETLSVAMFKPGDVIPGAGLVVENMCGLPWPSDVYGNLYMGCVLLDSGELRDARSGHLLGSDQRKTRCNNLVYNYEGRYKPRVSVTCAYKLAFTKALVATAMDLHAIEAHLVSADTLKWDALTEAQRTEYMTMAYRKLGISFEIFPPEELEYLQSLPKAPRATTVGDIMLRRASMKVG